MSELMFTTDLSKLAHGTMFLIRVDKERYWAVWDAVANGFRSLVSEAGCFEIQTIPVRAGVSWHHATHELLNHETMSDEIALLDVLFKAHKKHATRRH